MHTVTTAPMGGIVMLPVGTVWVLVLSATRTSIAALDATAQKIAEGYWAWDDITIHPGPPCPAGEVELHRRITEAVPDLTDAEWSRFTRRSLRGLRVDVDPRSDVGPDATETTPGLTPASSRT
ncbi:hypothetical protein [Parafrankia sp. EUN1f]|uniref:hypothetical protein n=1 Tax=Parafrankia sp. EUN1f TaxID=102897 RepID=UPI0001C47560|nr:hypothetical protein [Parafrankia sp. EUN1f]EFC79298.1 hypothetical protein FrEUN1fDRAFT_7573 [Parafrankia sp. EUN1f]